MNLGHAYENSSSNTPASPSTMRCRFSPYLEQGICKLDQCTNTAALHCSPWDPGHQGALDHRVASKY
jgi:hypothetical protein